MEIRLRRYEKRLQNGLIHARTVVAVDLEADAVTYLADTVEEPKVKFHTTVSSFTRWAKGCIPCPTQQ